MLNLPLPGLCLALEGPVARGAARLVAGVDHVVDLLDVGGVGELVGLLHLQVLPRLLQPQLGLIQLA